MHDHVEGPRGPRECPVEDRRRDLRGCWSMRTGESIERVARLETLSELLLDARLGLHATRVPDRAALTGRDGSLGTASQASGARTVSFLGTIIRTRAFTTRPWDSHNGGSILGFGYLLGQGGHRWGTEPNARHRTLSCLWFGVQELCNRATAADRSLTQLQNPAWARGSAGDPNFAGWVVEKLPDHAVPCSGIWNNLLR